MSHPSNPAEWARLRQLLDAALDLDGEARRTYCRALRLEDAALGAEIERLLATHERAIRTPLPSAMELAASTVVDLALDEAEYDRARVGQIVGSYRLLQLLGAGGMGAVYLAEHAETQFEHKVALKVVRKALGSRVAIDRFERERHLLAGLKHAGIALLFDGGQTAEGQPYYTMEYIDGKPITEYCESNVLPVAQRVALLLRVAGTLAYAHQNLIVHRDIKASNVLVTAAGDVKLVDFGLAKLLDEAALPSMTQTGLGPMTPVYAAPEQFHNAPITVATDIYQFGVLSFLVLTGRLPYRADPNDNLAWALAVTEKEEPLSLRRAHEMTDPQQPRASVRRFNRQLTPDLDAIVRKCLSKASERRYRSIDAMIADFENYLAGRPVRARRATPWYFFWRFVTRRRNVVIGLLLASVVLTVDVSVYFRTAAERARRLTRETDVRDVTRAMLEELLGGERSDSTRPRSSLEAIDRDTERAMRLFGANPEHRAIATSVLAASYLEYGHADRALQLANASLDALGSNRANFVDHALQLDLLSARAAWMLGDSASAERSLAQAERAMSALRLPSWAPERLAAATTRLQLQVAHGYGKAAAAMAQLIRDSDTPRLNTTLEFATLLAAYGVIDDDDRRAIAALDRAIPILEQHYGENSPTVMRARRAWVLRNAEGTASLDGEQLLTDQEARISDVFGRDSPDSADSIVALGNVQWRHGNADGAYASCTRVSKLIEGSNSVMPETRIDVADLCAEAALALHRPTDAAQYAATGIALSEASSEPNAGFLLVSALSACQLGQADRAFVAGEGALDHVAMLPPLNYRAALRNATSLKECLAIADKSAEAARLSAKVADAAKRR